MLDLACGTGRNARWLAQQGFLVEAVDRDEVALATLQDMKNISTRVIDLENSPWLYIARKFDAIIACRYLHRPLLPLLPASLADKGVLIYETFMQGQEALGRPANPAFLLQPDELLQIYLDQANIVAFEQGLFLEPQPAMLQRICLTRQEQP